MFILPPGATEDAINQAREEFHAHVASKKQSLQPDYTDEELLMEDTVEMEREYSGSLKRLSFVKANISGLMEKSLPCV